MKDIVYQQYGGKEGKFNVYTKRLCKTMRKGWENAKKSGGSKKNEEIEVKSGIYIYIYIYIIYI